MILSFLLSLLIATTPHPNIEKVLQDVDRAIERGNEYSQAKEKRIAGLKSEIGQSNEFVVANQLFNEYRYYQYDSAYIYARKLESIAENTGKPNEKAIAQSALLFCYKSVGFFSEAVAIIESFNPDGLPKSLCANFYQLCAETYLNLSSYVGSVTDLGAKYDALKLHYYQLALENSEEYTYFHDNVDLTLKLTVAYTDSLAIDARIAHINQYRFSIDEHELGVQYAILAMAMDALKRNEEAIYYRALSTICDIHTCTRETTSSMTLAQYMYKAGELVRAHNYINQALNEANFYNSRLRVIEINSILPQIEDSRFNKVNRQRMLYLGFGAIVLILLLLSTALFIRLRRSNRELKLTHEKLKESAKNLSESNETLSQINDKLKEVNEIKDSYIIQSLYVNPDFVNYVEKQSKAILAKIGTKQYDEAKAMLHKLNIKGERERIYSSFDQAFLKLFPNFIEEMNKLFPAEHQISLDENGGIPMELRIFALMRLGIENPQQIGEYLNLSVNTVYVYKANLKAKSSKPKEGFEAAVLAIPKL